MQDLSVTTAPFPPIILPPRLGGGGDFASRLLLAETGLTATPGDASPLAGLPPPSGMAAAAPMPGGMTWDGAEPPPPPPAGEIAMDGPMPPVPLEPPAPPSVAMPEGPPADAAPAHDREDDGGDASPAECGGGVPVPDFVPAVVMEPAPAMPSAASVLPAPPTVTAIDATPRFGARDSRPADAVDRPAPEAAPRASDPSSLPIAVQPQPAAMPAEAFQPPPERAEPRQATPAPPAGHPAPQGAGPVPTLAGPAAVVPDRGTQPREVQPRTTALPNAETTAMILGQETERRPAADPAGARPPVTQASTPNPMAGGRDGSFQGDGRNAAPPLPETASRPEAPATGPDPSAAPAPAHAAPVVPAPTNDPAPPAATDLTATGMDVPIADAPAAGGEATQAGAAPAQAAPAAAPAPEPTQLPDAPAPTRLAEQIVPAIIRLDSDPAGTQRLTIRLDPVELGQLEIRIERTDDATRVNVLVERPETLELLRRDQPALERALDQAGMPADQRDVVLQLAPADPRPMPEARPAPFDPASQMAGQGGQTPGGAASDDPGRTPRHAGDGQARGHAAGRGATGEETGTNPGRRAPDWRRTGLDITA